MAAFAQIQVTANLPAAVLAQRLAGRGVLISDPVLHCSAQANGLFKVVSSNLGLDSGIVLTTGRAASGSGVYGINGSSTGLASSDNGFPGDATLTSLAGQTTKDACTLEFDVTPMGDTISIGYVFSSEEYINAVCGPYNDAFAFFISGPGISGTKNMALVPGTNIPVTINSINNGIPGSAGSLVNCTSMGTGSPFTAYYTDNAYGNTLTHRGLTKVLKAVCAVTQCGKYHLKIAIADAGNAKYDSGVFLEAGSLQSESYAIQALASPIRDTILAACVKGCLPGHFKVRRTKSKPIPQTIKLVLAGSAKNGIDYAPIADSVVIPAFVTSVDVAINGLPTPLNGVKALQVFILSPTDCIGLSSIIDSATLFIYDTINIALQPHDTVICAGDSIRFRVSGDDIYSYSWLPDLRLSGNTYKEPIATPIASTIYTVTASLPDISCPFKSATSQVLVKLSPSITLVQDTVVCGGTSFQLSPMLAQDNMFYSYQWHGPGGFASSLRQPFLNNVSIKNEGRYHLQVKIDSNGCSSAADVTVAVNVVDTPVVSSPLVLCQNTAASALYVDGDNITWYDDAGKLLGNNAPVVATDYLGAYNYFVSRKTDNCESTRKELSVAVKKCCDGSIFIPNAFTPNGDGKNDLFRAVAGYGYFVKNMAVYNRWGQVVFSGNSGMWDGNFGTNAAAADTYFYKIIFGCILGGTEERVGDVILIK